MKLWRNRLAWLIHEKESLTWSWIMRLQNCMSRYGSLRGENEQLKEENQRLKKALDKKNMNILKNL